MSSWLKTGAVLFALPIVAYFFFNYANALQTKELHSGFERGIMADKALSQGEKAEYLETLKNYDFESICVDYNNQESKAIGSVNQLGIAAECKHYRYFTWARFGALALIGMGLLHVLLIAAFVSFAKKSQQKLLIAFGAAWASSTLVSMLILLGQGALATATLYFASTLLFKVYFPKLLVFIVLAVGYALYRIVRVLFSNTAPVSHEPTSEAVSEEAAPLLWQRVRDIAHKLGTTAPDSILVGMNTAFYVTEFPVVHSAGVAIGRTLHLSAPMMQQLSTEEVSAIIGHEMGHFKGEDTVMTRRLAPRIIKSENTLGHLYEAGIVGRPAFYAMLVFRNLFEKTISTFKRERELAADAYGASITSRKTAALALIRYSYQNEVYDNAMSEHMLLGTKMEEVLPRLQDELRTNNEFWEALSTHGLPHPFDTHPPMKVRLEKLGFKVEDLRSDACEKVENAAFDAFMGGSHAAISNAMQQQQHIVEHIQEQIAVKTADENELSPELIAKHFPRIVLKSKTSRIVKQSIEGFFLALLPPLFIAAMTVAITTSTPSMRSSYVLISSLIGCATLFFCLALLFKAVRRWSSETLVLDFKGVKLGSWKEEARFADMESIHMTSEGKPFFTKYYLKIKFAGKNAAFAKRWRIFGKHDYATINLSIFEGDATQNGETVLRYLTRGLAQ